MARVFLLVVDPDGKDMRSEGEVVFCGCFLFLFSAVKMTRTLCSAEYSVWFYW
jgi:hypothetical protein